MLNKYNLNLGSLVAKESTSRYTLEAIRVEKSKTIVTDGHLLVTVTTPDYDTHDFPMIDGAVNTPDHEAFNLPAKTALEVSKALPSGKAITYKPILGNALVGRDNGSVILSITDLQTPKVFKTTLADNQIFPDYDKVIPSNTTVKAEVNLNPELLLKLLKTITEFTKNESVKQITLTIHEDGAPIKITCNGGDNQELVAILMPMSSRK